MPHRSSIPLYWRLKKSKYRLVGTRCMQCSSVFFPPRNICHTCRRKGKVEEFAFSGNGSIVSFTIIRAAPEGFEQYAPYAVAIIRLDEGQMVSGQIVGDVNNIEIGKRVRSVFRKVYEDGEDGLIHYGSKFEVVEQSSA